MAVPARGRAAVIAFSLIGTLAFLGLAALGFGGLAALIDHPARAGFVVASVVLALVALASPVNLSGGEREDVRNRWVFAPAGVGLALLFWLAPYLDRRDLWTVGGDATRWLGLATFVGGSILRIWPMFVLGHRFSGLVAIQPGHELVTRGPYRWVRNPSYLGLLVGLVGWALVFRSGVGLAAIVLGIPILIARIRSEEALLASHFGSAYEAYRARTWRLLPGLY